MEELRAAFANEILNRVIHLLETGTAGEEEINLAREIVIAEKDNPLVVDAIKRFINIRRQ